MITLSTGQMLGDLLLLQGACTQREEQLPLLVRLTHKLVIKNISFFHSLIHLIYPLLPELTGTGIIYIKKNKTLLRYKANQQFFF